MTGNFFVGLSHVTCVLLAVRQALAQDGQCYYPDGSEADEKPCSTAEGSACCPDKWECLDNGLCYYEPDDYYGRYSCTDQSWESDGCPKNLCTDVSQVGAEAVVQCSNHGDQWCCDADRVHIDCCQESPAPRPFFDLPNGQVYAEIGQSTADEAPNVATITGMADEDGGDSSPTQTPDPTSSEDDPPSSSSRNDDDDDGGEGDSSRGPSSTPAPSTPATSLTTTVASGSSGIETIVETIVTEVPAPTTASSENDEGSGPGSGSGSGSGSDSDSGSGGSKKGVIIGCAVGIPLGLALLGILIWLFRKRAQQKKEQAHPYSETPDPYTNGDASPDFAGGAKLSKTSGAAGAGVYKNEKAPDGVPELSGQSVGPGRPVSMMPGRAELDSGSGFVPGSAPHAPHLVGVGGGNGAGHSANLGPGHTPQSSMGGSWASAPPGYSSGGNQAAWTPSTPAGPPPGSSELDGSGPMPGFQGGGVSSGAIATEGGRYIPYRPPQGHAAYGGGEGAAPQNRPEEAAELSAVTTPPPRDR